MFLLAQENIKLDCSAEEAFNYIANLENFAAWFPGVIKMASGNDLPHGQVGKTYLETVSMPLAGQREVAIRVVESDVPRRLVTEGRLPVLWPRMEIEVDEVEEGKCEIRWRMLSRNRHILARYLLPLLRRALTKRAITGMQNLKQRLEAIRQD